MNLVSCAALDRSPIYSAKIPFAWPSQAGLHNKIAVGDTIGTSKVQTKTIILATLDMARTESRQYLDSGSTLPRGNQQTQLHVHRGSSQTDLPQIYLHLHSDTSADNP